MTAGRAPGVIRIRGARQNNLRNLDLDLPTLELIVVTGVSGSGKSSLVFDTLYAEGQRRYVETFGAYARQFLDRQDRPRVDSIEGIAPAVAIDQTNPVRSSRSTVGTMSELADHLKLLFARAATLACRGCARIVRRDTPQTILAELLRRSREAGDPRLAITFPVPLAQGFPEEEVLRLLAAQGYTRIHARGPEALEVVQDRLRLSEAGTDRALEAIEAALRLGRGRIAVHPLETGGEPATCWRFSAALHCPYCDIAYADPDPGMFSFNSPIGACETCRGFGRVIGIDFGLVVPDEAKSLAEGAVRPWQTESYRECQDDLMKYAKRRGIPTGTPWRGLTESQRAWVLEGEPEWKSWRRSWPGTWYGVRRFFEWLETKSYKMHIRVLLSRYRAYTPCPACGGARLKPEALLWRLGTCEDADAVLDAGSRFRPSGTNWSDAAAAALPGLTIHDLARLPISRTREFFDRLHLPAALDEACAGLTAEIRRRLAYLCEVGLGYLTLDRASRTLSGGEVQRINLTTALGTSLVNTLFVLDEPSIGLHPRDMQRVIAVMRGLRDAGNSIVVVEHDPQIMAAADRILDLGPGPGASGGRIVFFGTPGGLAAERGSLTADYLCGRRRADAGVAPNAPDANGPRIELIGAAAHNLKNVDVAIPLERLVCVTGVSGSGKSSLVEDVLYAALLKAKGRPVETGARLRELRGHERIAEVVLVDQSPIGKTTRSNPASYVGAFDAIRALFAREPEAKRRGYGAGMFSFNAGRGRCPGCGGNGFERVEMQFLADVYLRCPDCGGSRYRPEVLEIVWRGRSIAQVLELTVSEAMDFFADFPKVTTRLRPLAEVGLDYLRLGQSVPTLSGGEAQRLKLAGHLAEAALGRAKATLLLFDEPTTGLHFDDISKLLAALRRLLAAGHSLVVIEHNLDVIRSADWVIDLGPEGGEGGGRIVCEGTPERIAACPDSATGRALREYEEQFARWSGATARAEDLREPAAPETIHVVRANEHNLRNVDVEIPRDAFTVITGVSGSGKSTLAFDILFAEGQRRYLESLNAYARQFVQPAARADVEAVRGIPPTVAIEQRASRGGRKSTVGTLTEIHHFLRLLYVRLGVQHCPKCGDAIEPQSAEAILARILKARRGERVGVLAPLVNARKGYYTELARWARAKGHTHLRVDGEFLPTAKWPRLERFKLHTIELPVADLVVRTEAEGELRSALARALELGKGTVSLVWPLDALARSMASGGAAAALEREIFSTRRACPSCATSFPEPDPRLFSYNSRHGWCPACFGTGVELPGFDADQSGEEISWNEWYALEPPACPECGGARLNPTALAVRLHGRNIAELSAIPAAQLHDWLAGLALDEREAQIGRDCIAEIRSRLAFLGEVGLGYLALDRAAPTLSGGEAQRIRLAAQLGSNLQGVCYILDEPTIGLHPRDNRMLLDVLARLRARGNTLVVVEHDEETIRRADHVIDLGPGAGARGGMVVAEGDAQALMRQPASVTGRFLAQPLRHPFAARRPVAADAPALFIREARAHNLAGIDARIPLGRITVLTGVSGSGKSSLAHDVLRASLIRLLSGQEEAGVAGCREIEGWEAIARVLEVDQTPIGRTPRSCPATYVGLWDGIRRLFAETTQARMSGYAASRFSFNSAGGRCEACAGQGVQKVEMSFLPDVQVRCEACAGARFDPQTLEVRWRGRSIAEVLAMSVDEAVEFFAAHPRIHRAAALLQEVGLGYLRLGQASPTLSGGEAQRIKLVSELARVRGQAAGGRGTLYLLDEPTVGLHMADVEKLIHVLHRLVDAGNTVVVVEHNLDVIAEADWVIDLGPEGGAQGGRLVAEGPPEIVAGSTASHTGRILAGFLSQRGRMAPA
ncbi:MAG: excinuclease ABC subunit UvrA [Rhodocyclaceae bacterium]